MSLISIEVLLLKRQQLLDEKAKMASQFDQDITSIETSIEVLSGKKVWEVVQEERFDDENPHYIKSSIEE